MSRQMKPVDAGERAKMAELQKDADSKSHKVEWIYSGDKIDRDAYLLGKPIDKLLIEKEIEKPKEDIVLSTVDLANKIREDPLFEIKKREIEAKKRLLENPVRLRQLKELISKKSKQNSGDSDSEQARSREKHKQRGDERESKERRHSKKVRRHSSSDDSDSDLKRKHRRREKPEKDKKKKKKRSRSRSKSSRSSSASRSQVRKPGYGLIKKTHSDSEEDSRPAAKSSKQLEIEECKRRIEQLRQLRTNSGRRPPDTKNLSSKMSDEEKQRRLLEMQENAKWRNETRSSTAHKHRADERKEAELEDENNCASSQAKASHMFNNIMRDAYVSAEDRIKRNIKNVQRNRSAFDDKNFARK